MPPAHSDSDGVSGSIELHTLPGRSTSSDFSSCAHDRLLLPSSKSHQSRCLAYSPDGKLLVVAHKNDDFEIFDMDTYALVHRLNKNMSDGCMCVFSPAGDVLACAGTNCGYWTLFDVKPPVRAGASFACISGPCIYNSVTRQVAAKMVRMLTSLADTRFVRLLSCTQQDTANIQNTVNTRVASLLLARTSLQWETRTASWFRVGRCLPLSAKRFGQERGCPTFMGLP